MTKPGTRMRGALGEESERAVVKAIRKAFRRAGLKFERLAGDANAAIDSPSRETRAAARRTKMTRTVTAEYVAGEHLLRLDEPIEGLGDGVRVRVTLESEPSDESRPWLALRNSLSPEAGDSMAKAVEEMFGKVVD